MELHDAVMNLAAAFGCSFDDVYAIMLFSCMALFVGIGFACSFLMDVGEALYKKVVKKAVVRLVRLKDAKKKEP